MRLVTKLGRMTVAAVAGLTATVGLAALTSTPAGATTVNRNYAGATRYETSAMIGEAKFPSGVPSKAVVLASGAKFPDALGGNYLAGQLAAPILLTPATAADPEFNSATLPALAKLLPSKGTVYILGGTLAVGTDVETAITGAGYTTKRIQGPTRYDTDQQAATQAGQTPGNGTSGAPTGILATGFDDKFPDALAAGPLSFKQKFPVILTDGTASTLGSQAQAIITADHISHLIVMGGDAAINPAIITSLPSGVTVDKQFKGVDRTDTAAQALDYMIANYGFPSGKVFLTSGADFPDALSSGPLGGDPEGDVMTEPDKTLGTYSTAEAKKLAPGTIDILGGTFAVPDGTAAAMKTAAEQGGFTATTTLPQLIKASIVSTTASSQATSSNAKGTVVQYNFSQSLSGAAFHATAFHVYPAADDVFAGAGFVASGICGPSAACPLPTDPNAVNVLYDPATGAGGVPFPLETTTGTDSASTLTLATVLSDGTAGGSAVALTSGAFSPVGAVPIGAAATSTPTANVTAAPDLASFTAPRNASAASSSAIDLIFDKAAVPPVAPGGYNIVFSNTASNGGSPGVGEVACTGPTAANSTTLGGQTTQSYNTTTKTVTIVCPNPTGSSGSTITLGQIAWIVVQPGTVQTTDAVPVANGQLEASSSPAQSTALNAIRLTGLTLTPGSGTALDQAVFTFDQGVTVTTPGSFKLVTQAAGTIAATGPCTTATPSAPGCLVSSTTTTTSVDMYFAHGTFAGGGGSPVVGGEVLAMAVASSTTPATKNADDELGAANAAATSQTPGLITAAQLTSGTAATSTNGLGQVTVTATYKFDFSVMTPVTAKFHGYDADGTELTCAAAPTIGTGSADNTAACTSFIQQNGGSPATASQLSGIKLMTVDAGAVLGNTGGGTPAPNGLGNPEGAVNP